MPEVTPPETLDEFAAELRHLRIDAGNPTLAAISRTTGVSKTVLSEALSGRRLPSARTVAALATAFDVDPRTLVRRRDALGSAGTRSEESIVALAAPEEPPSPIRRSWLTWWTVAAAFLVGAVVSGVVTGIVVDGDRAPAVARASATGTATDGSASAVGVRTGTDPADTRCVDDAVVAASATRTAGAQLQILYSADCHAAWARITRTDDASTGNEVSAWIYRKAAPNGTDRQSTTEPDAQSAYTTLLVRPTPDTELCADGSITTNGSTVDLGDPICL